MSPIETVHHSRWHYWGGMVSVDVVYFTVMEILGGHERSVAIVGQGDEAEDGRWGDPRRPRSEAAGNGPGNMLHEDPDTLAV